jgi:ubiquitin carboxyl-terminal hydrolase 34
LKPYSYHDVIARDPKHDVDPLAKTEAEPDQEEPAEDDCFEYKLVGVNMHSGTANAGHYWSYINLIRGLQEKNINDLTWGDTSKDPWMEFNDSTVSNWNYKEKMQKDCFGDEKQSTQNTYASNSWSMGAYGKSGYMLFYERRIKKPI